ncbi:MAG: response regulator transcription factor [Woeseiaceae bacterium]
MSDRTDTGTIRTMARALIVEDNPAFSSVLNRILQEDAGFEGAIIAGSLAEARKVLQRVSFPLVLLDLGLPDGRGTELLADIPDESCTIVVTVFGEESAVIEAMALGADSYLLKDDPMLGQSIVAALNGEASLSPAVATHLLSSWRRLTGANGRTKRILKDAVLSPREAEILQRFAEGLSYCDTAERLGISRHTVADHVKSIYRKLTVNSRAEAVSKGLRKGLISLPTDAA